VNHNTVDLIGQKKQFSAYSWPITN